VSTWVTFATDIGMGAPYVRGRVGELANAVLTHVSDVADRLADAGTLNHGELARIATLVRTRAKRVAETATATPRPPRGARRPLRRPAPPRE
jgi:hypothetical protein